MSSKCGKFLVGRYALRVLCTKQVFLSKIKTEGDVNIGYIVFKIKGDVNMHVLNDKGLCEHTSFKLPRVM